MCRAVRQGRDFSFQVDMRRFIEDRLGFVPLARGRAKEAHADASAEEVSAPRAVLGACNWLAKEGRPDASAAASLLSGAIPTLKVQDIIGLDCRVWMLKESAGEALRIQGVPMDRLMFSVCSDASLGNASRGGSQVAHLVLASDRSLTEGASATTSIVSWRSHRITRAASSTMAAKTMALSQALAHLGWVECTFAE